MTTWQDVKSFIYRNYSVNDDTGDMLVLLLNTDSVRSQYVLIAGDSDSAALRVSSPIGRTDAIEGNVLLSLSSNRIMGVKQVGDMYYVTSPLLSDEVTGALLDTLILLAADEADSYERDLGLGDAY